MMQALRGSMALVLLAGAALSQEAQVAPAPQRQGTTVPAGVPLRIALERRVAIKSEGQPVQGRLVDPIYVYDRLVLPAGCLVEGRIAEIGGVPFGQRLKALLSGNLTPPREVRARFDSLLLPDGSRLSLQTSPSRGTPHTQRLSRLPKPHESLKFVPPSARAAFLAFRTPGKLTRLKSTLLGMLPYHRQAWQAGTLFNNDLQDPVTAAAAVETPFDSLGESAEVQARLVTPLASATARVGSPVEAVVTQPQFSASHSLLIPEGSRLFGEVVQARKARRFHRNGKLLFVFHQLQLPSAPARNIQGYLDGVDADLSANLDLDPEGGTRVRSPKTRLIFPAIAMAVAGLSIHQDYNAEGVPDQDIAGRAESGAVGLGLIGTGLAQASRTLASTIAFTGAGFSVYFTFIARGQDVVLPVSTPVTVGFRKSAAQPGAR